MDFLQPYLPALGDGVRLTLVLTAIGLASGSAGGLALALMRLSSVSVFRRMSYGFVTFVVCTPVLVHLYWIYYVAPQAIGLRLDDLTVLGLALGVYASALLAETYRAGIQAVDPGQREAASVLGLTTFQAFRYVVFPQAVRVILPLLGSVTIAILKDSSIATFIGTNDLLNVGRSIAGDSFRPLEVFSLIALMYFALTYPISVGSSLLERRLRT